MTATDRTKHQKSSKSLKKTAKASKVINEAEATKKTMKSSKATKKVVKIEAIKIKRKPVIAGNWKMNLNDHEVKTYINKLKRSVSGVKDREIIICPTFVSLRTASEAVRSGKKKQILIGAQNVFYEDFGAFTGEVSALALKDYCDYVIVGHSERRDIFKETDEVINRKIVKALSHGLKVIFCIGEHLSERESASTTAVLSSQLSHGLKRVTEKGLSQLIIAYEPVWAIGTGKTATPLIAEEAHRFIRRMISELYSGSAAEKIRIIYGGSVKPENIDVLMAEPDIDGVLVGGASLDIHSFLKIIRFG